MQQYTRIEPPMKMKAAGDFVLYGTAQGILLALLRGTDNICRKVKFPVVLVLGLERNFCQVQRQLKTVSKL